MGIQLSDWVENIVGKGEIARYQQFLLFPHCFQKLSYADASKWLSTEYRVNSLGPIMVVSDAHVFPGFLIPVLKQLSFFSHNCFIGQRRKYAGKKVENIVGKGENAGNQHFLFFPTMFSTSLKTNFTFSVRFTLSNAFNLDQ